MVVVSRNAALAAVVAAAVMAAAVDMVVAAAVAEAAAVTVEAVAAMAVIVETAAMAAVATTGTNTLFVKQFYPVPHYCGTGFFLNIPSGIYPVSISLLT